MPSQSASSKFVLSVLKFLGILKFLRCTQNSLGQYSNEPIYVEKSFEHTKIILSIHKRLSMLKKFEYARTKF